MKSEAVQLAVDLGTKLGHVFVATADAKGSPHLAAARSITPASEGRVAVDAWFCPGTVANLAQNQRIAIAVRAHRKIKGFKFWEKWKRR